MFLLFLQINPLPSRRRELIEILHTVTGPTSIQPGCLGCNVYEGSGDSQAVLYFERWNSEEELHRHIVSPLYVRLLAAMELSATKPDLAFYETTHSWGLELVESLRTAVK